MVYTSGLINTSSQPFTVTVTSTLTASGSGSTVTGGTGTSIIFLISERLGIIYDTKPVKDPVKIGNVTTTPKRLVTVYLFHIVLRACSLP